MLTFTTCDYKEKTQTLFRSHELCMTILIKVQYFFESLNVWKLATWKKIAGLPDSGQISQAPLSLNIMRMA